jgi:catechol 2,3-dioxygenase-like lactoylglutathione lyase family enzyme
MQEQLLRVYSEATNQAVIQPPGRKFPGVVIQGDSLSNLAQQALHVASWMRSRAGIPNDVFDAAHDVMGGLVGRALHYQRVLEEHGIRLPYGKPFTDADRSPEPLRVPRLTYIVLRCKDVETSQRFYSALGLSITREQHGRGPLHYSATFGETTLELYPEQGESSVGLRLGLHSFGGLESVQHALRVGGTLVSPVMPTDDDTRFVIRDPDGHTLDLLMLPS